LKISFNVSYRFGEYMTFVRARARIVMPVALAADGAAVSPLRLRLALCLLYCVAALAYFRKQSKSARYRFEIEASGISRAPKSGQFTLLPWDKIAHIYTFDVGYMFMIRNGGIPIPLRVFDDGQAARLAQYVLAWRQLDIDSGPQ
jgi:hypothetical protein